MIHWLTIFIIIPATPSNPTHPATLRLARTHQLAISWVKSPWKSQDFADEKSKKSGWSKHFFLHGEVSSCLIR